MIIDTISTLREAILKDEAQYEDTKLKDYQVQNKLLYQDDLL